MISSFFGKTKPINYIIVIFFIFTSYWIVRFLWLQIAVAPLSLLSNMGVLSFLIFSLYIINFIVKRNKITKTNSFTILLYALFYFVFPESLTDNNGIFCNFFLLLAARKLLSLKSLKYIKYKIFDASLWIVIASLFYDWALVYLIWVFVAIFIYEPKSIRNWLTPLSTIISFFLIMFGILVLLNNTSFLTDHYTFSFKIDKDTFLQWSKSTRLSIYILVGVVSGVWGSIKLGKIGVGRNASMRLIVASFFLGVILMLLESSSGLSSVIVTFFPVAVFLTNFIENIRKPQLRELTLISLIVVSFLVFIFEVLIN